MSSNQGNKFRVVGGVEGGGSASSARTDGAGLKPLSIDELYQHMCFLRHQLLEQDLESVQAKKTVAWAEYQDLCKREFELMGSLHKLESNQADLFAGQ